MFNIYRRPEEEKSDGSEESTCKLLQGVAKALMEGACRIVAEMACFDRFQKKTDTWSQQRARCSEVWRDHGLLER